jgi:hypothetical protein
MLGKIAQQQICGFLKDFLSAKHQLQPATAELVPQHRRA